MSNLLIGFAWFNKEDWEEWKKICPDIPEDKYEDWLTEVSKAKAGLENEDEYTMVKVKITPSNFKNWCQKNNKLLNQSSRAEYTVDLLHKAHE